MWEKNKGTTECDKSTITCDVSTTQCENCTIKYEKKKKRKKRTTKCGIIQSHVMLILHNMRMIPLNVRKNKGTTECDKRTVTCDVGTA